MGRVGEGSIGLMGVASEPPHWPALGVPRLQHGAVQRDVCGLPRWCGDVWVVWPPDRDQRWRIYASVQWAHGRMIRIVRDGAGPIHDEGILEWCSLHLRARLRSLMGAHTRQRNRANGVGR